MDIEQVNSTVGDYDGNYFNVGLMQSMQQANYGDIAHNNNNNNNKLFLAQLTAKYYIIIIRHDLETTST